MDNTKLISTKEYAAFKNCTPRNIQIRIKSYNSLPFVKRIMKVGSTYMLEVAHDLSADNFKKKLGA